MKNPEMWCNHYDNGIRKGVKYSPFLDEMFKSGVLTIFRFLSLSLSLSLFLSLSLSLFLFLWEKSKKK